jgi:hypothetical protein
VTAHTSMGSGELGTGVLETVSAVPEEKGGRYSRTWHDGNRSELPLIKHKSDSESATDCHHGDELSR